MHGCLSQLHSSKRTSADPLREAPLSAAMKDRPGAAWAWGFSSGWLWAARSCRQSWSSVDSGAHPSSTTFYHHAALKPLQPDRGLPNPSEALLPNPQRRLCQQHEDHQPKMFRKAACPFTHTQRLWWQRGSHGANTHILKPSFNPTDGRMERWIPPMLLHKWLDATSNLLSPAAHWLLPAQDSGFTGPACLIVHNDILYSCTHPLEAFLQLKWVNRVHL